MKLTDDQLATLNLRLQQLGFESMGDYARALTEGVVGNKQLVGTLAEDIADRIVVKMTTSATRATDAAPAMKTVRSPGFEPGLQAWRACVLLALLTLDQAGRRPHDLRAFS
jgi:hypothetical protein